MKIRAELGRKHGSLCPDEYLVDKVVELPGVQFASFMMRPLDRYEFIQRNMVEPHQGNGFNHCLLVLSDDRADGVLVECGFNGRVVNAAYVAGARDVVQAKLDRAADFIIRQGADHTTTGEWRVCCEELDEKLGVIIYDDSGLDTMLEQTLKRRPEVAQAEVAFEHVELTLHPEFCQHLRSSAPEKTPSIRLRDILPLIADDGRIYIRHEDADTPVWPEHLQKLTAAGREDYAALLDAKAAVIKTSPTWTRVILTDVEPEELMRFNEAYEAFQEAEQAMGDMTP